jgi:N-glycosylase/DNA lyase
LPDSVLAPYWNQSDCTSRPLDLALTLTSGQAFRWRRDEAGIWWGTVGGTVVALWQAEAAPASPLYWQTAPEPDGRDIVENYFALDVPLDDLYVDWTRSEPLIADAVRAYRGLRVLRQPTVECFFAFQCATCNTVVRIQRSIEWLAARYGESIPLRSAVNDLTVGAQGSGPPALALPGSLPLPFRAFPTIERLADADEGDLRQDLWGYRAPRLISLARHVVAERPGWLDRLRLESYSTAKAELVALHGVGEKIADCICLFCLDKQDAVPVDTHVRQIACELFTPELRDRSLTPRVYAAIADAYRSRFSPFAGWAQQYLFMDSVTESRRPSFRSPSARLH